MDAKGTIASVLLFSVLSLMAGIMMGLGFSLAPVQAALEPHPAYCRGLVDGEGGLLVDLKYISQASFDNTAPSLEQKCIAALDAGEEFRVGRHGPLGVEP